MILTARVSRKLAKKFNLLPYTYLTQAMSIASYYCLSLWSVPLFFHAHRTSLGAIDSAVKHLRISERFND